MTLPELTEPLMPLEAEFGYRIAPCDEGWAWKAYDEAGQLQASGAAPTKAIAAACVIREIARSADGSDADR